MQETVDGYDYANYLYSQGIYGIIYVDNYSEVGSRTNIINIIRNSILNVFGSLFPQDEGSIIIGMLIGDTTYISDDVNQSFKDSGISHLLAVSGSNVAFVVLMTKFVFDKIFGKSISKYLCIITIIVFILVSGCSLSVVRAGLMAILMILFNVFLHREDTISSISISCLLILLFNPISICDVGFILSYGGTIGIIAFYTPIKKFFLYKLENFKENKVLIYFIDIFSVTLSAQIILIPIMNYFFNTFSIVSFLTNLLVGPFVGVITIYGFILYFIGLLSINIAKILVFPLYLFVKIIILISKFCSSIPFGTITTPTINWIFILMYYSIVLYLYKKKKTLKYLIILLVLIQLLLFLIPHNYVSLNMIDVGQGDAFLIKTCNNKNILIDGGGSEGSDYDVGEKVLVPYLLDNTNGIIDVVFVTHFHEDHAEGIINVLNDLKVKKLIIGNQPIESSLYLEALKIAKNKGVEVITVYSKDKIIIDNVTFTILYPENKIENTTDLNNTSLMIRADIFDTSILFTGDAEIDEEELLLNYYKSEDDTLDIDILKVGHHGSKTSSSEDFLKATTPKICLISCGVDNKFNHPHQEVINRLSTYTNNIFRTDLKGEINIKIRKNSIITIKSQL